MRLIKKRHLVIFFSVFFLFQACDLQRQKSFDFNEDAHWEKPEPFDFTIYQYIQQEDQFSMMEQAIQRAGMESTFTSGNPPVNEDSETITVLLLRNEAMEEFLNDYNYGSISSVPVSTLQNLLKYHVIPARVKQRDVNVQEHTIFQTLLDGDEGKIDIYIYRDFWLMSFNSDGSGFPATSKSAGVYLHNFEFTNGIGHHVKSYVQRVPFE